MLRDASGKLVITKGIQILLISAAVIAVAAVSVLGAFLGIYVDKDNKNGVKLENAYERAYYNLTDGVLQMETNLSKTRVVRSSGLLTDCLCKAEKGSALAVNSLAALSDGAQGVEQLIKFCNQAGDFCSYAINKTANGHELSETDYSSVSKLYETSFTLGKSLNEVREKIDDGFRFVESVGEVNNEFAAVVEELTDGTMEYPSLIYDGAFSDSLETRAPKALENAQEVSQAEAEEAARKALADYEVSELTGLGESKGYFDAYLFEFKTSDGASGSIQISKLGGLCAMFDVYEEVVDPTLSVEEGVELAKQYMAKLDLPDMTPVWQSVNGSQLFVNMVCENDGFVIYPDMIKLKISLQSGKVAGFEGLNYIFNHTERKLDAPTLTESEIRDMDFGNMTVDVVRPAVIPTSGGSERSAYEVYGKMGDFKFFVYVDAVTGEELRVMQVIDSDEGELLF